MLLPSLWPSSDIRNEKIFQQIKIVEMTPADEGGCMITPLAHGPGAEHAGRPQKPSFGTLTACNNGVASE